MPKYKVKIFFKNITSELIVDEADSPEQAEEIARTREVGPPVPLSVPVEVTEIARGGSRPGAGRPEGSVKPGEKYNKVMGQRYTPSEKKLITKAAEKTDLSSSDFIRGAALRRVKEVLG